uniref:Neuronal-specific septin-3 n=2 Tax=Oryzias latipes TaxID=8090 RepID=A0A3P9M0Y6_ORYLA
MEGMAVCGPAASYCSAHRLTFLFTHLNTREAPHQLLPNRMSVFPRLTPLLADPSAACRQTNEHPKVGLLPPLSSPVIKKKAIHLSSFDEKGLVFQMSDFNPSAAVESFDLVSKKTPHQSWKSEVRKKEKRENGQGALTNHRIKPETRCSPRLPANPNNPFFPKTDAPPLFPILKSADSCPSVTSQSKFYAMSHQPEPKPRSSPTLSVPTPRWSPSPKSLQFPDGQSGEHRSPVAKERHAHSILISNSRRKSCDEAKHEVLDQRALMDFTHFGLRVRPVMSKEHRAESRLSSTSQNPNKAGKNEPEKDHLKTPVTATSKIQQQQERQSGETEHCFGQNTDFRCRHQSEDHVFPVRGSGKMTSISKSPPNFSLANSESGSRRLESTIVDAASPSVPLHRKLQQENITPTFPRSPSMFYAKHGSPQDLKPPQEPRLLTKSQSPQMDTKSTESWSDCVSKGFNSQSRDVNQKPEAPLPAQRLNRLMDLLAPQIQEFSHSGSAGLSLHRGLPSNLDLFPASHKEVHVRVTDLNQTEPPDLHAVPAKPPEHPWPPSVGHCPLITNNPSSKRVSDLLLHRTYQYPEEGSTASAHQSVAGKTLLHEESEDSYYVTMFRPGSVYVDMSDIVPPEVRPKPAVPAKPPNVGIPSPSSSFPPQAPGFGGGGTSAPPPSAIPVPIGGHGGGHPAPQGGGHGHGGSQSSGGGSTLLGYIGIDTIIEQMRKKTMKTGFDFNIMVVGHSGLGKSTLVNTLFKSQVSRKSAGWARDEKIPKTVDIKSVSHVIEEGGVKMKLTIVDTPGFGDLINNDNCWEPISKYINEQYEKFLKEEVNITRKKRIPDTRVHCCLYFISPTGHSLRQLDVEFMKRLSHSVNIIPVIAKSDTMTVEEKQEFKQRVRKELEMNGIEFYPQKEFDDDMEDKSDNDKIRDAMPFAVVGSDKEYQVNGKRVLGRKTAWGIVEVENPNHCEFAQLRDFLIRSHLQDLKEVTHNIHYETYRARRLNENGGLHPICDTQDSNL